MGMRPSFRGHLQSLLTLGVALLILAVGWAGVAETPWWRALGVTPQQWWHLIPLGLMAFALLIRIRRPVLALVLGGGIALLDLSIGFNIGILLCLSDLVYNLGIRGSRRAVLAAAVALTAGTVASGVVALAFGADWEGALSIALVGFAVLLMPLWWAAEVRRGYPLWQEPDARHQLEAERHAGMLRRQASQRRQAVEQERQRMARELHDVVSSQVSAIALTSGAVLNAAADTERDRRALGSIRRTSVEALEQLRELVLLLRGEGRPGNAETVDYAELLDGTNWTDVLAVAQDRGMLLSVEGEPPESLSPGQHHVLLRVLQESLINAQKHGQAQATVSVRQKRQRLLLTVTSPVLGESSASPSLRTDDDAASRLGAGVGLAVMRERVQLVGGSLRAGPVRAKSPVTPGGPTLWAVEAEFPLERVRG